MIGSLDLCTLRALYAGAAATPQDVVREVYRRIKAKGVAPDWISLVPEATALARAAQAPRGPLFGIPFAVKDNIDVRGMETTCACPGFAYMAQRSATVVERLEAAGAILIGKTNLDQFATGLVGVRSPYGIPTSTFDPTYVSGGSSSGSAVAVAAGLVSFALGTDTAGSGRIPAAFNNIVGLKPTRGTVSTLGVVPACRTLDCVAILALTAGDAAEVMSVASAYDAADAFSRKDAPAFKVEAAAAHVRIGVPHEPLEFFQDASYEQLYGETVERMKGMGATIVPINFAPFREAAKLLYSGPWVAERYAAARKLLESRPVDVHEAVRAIMLGANAIDAATAFEGMYRLAELTRQAEAEWVRMDVMLLPTAGTTYKVADVVANPLQLNSNLGAYTNFVNLMDLSALAVPAGLRPDGIPFGVTLIGRAFEDGKLASLGDALHRALPAAELGATHEKLAATAPVRVALPECKTVQLAVVGAHLSGLTLHPQLTQRSATFVRTARTAAGYSFYALPGTTPPKPGLVFDAKGAGNIEVEIWEMGEAAFGSFVALIPSPLGIGTLQLADGSKVHGFVCEAHAIEGAKDITSFGGWRNWLNQQQGSEGVHPS